MTKRLRRLLGAVRAALDVDGPPPMIGGLPFTPSQIDDARREQRIAERQHRAEGSRSLSSRMRQLVFEFSERPPRFWAC